MTRKKEKKFEGKISKKQGYNYLSRGYGLKLEMSSGRADATS